MVAYAYSTRNSGAKARASLDTHPPQELGNIRRNTHHKQTNKLQSQHITLIRAGYGVASFSNDKISKFVGINSFFVGSLNFPFSSAFCHF